MAKSIADLYNKEIRPKIDKVIEELPVIYQNEAIVFFEENFDKQAWRGYSTQPWQKRKNPTKWGKKDETGRAILMKTGKGKDTIRPGRIENNIAYVLAGGTPAPYMKAHNTGFTGVVNQNVRPFTRKIKGKDQQVKGFSRTINQNIPKRQFIGGVNESPYLKARLHRIALLEFKQVFKK